MLAVCLQVLQRGQEVSKRDWKVLRVAIVELRDQTYIGRLFFGDADSGAVVWDCDCRPSDGCWIALKVRLAPMHAPVLGHELPTFFVFCSLTYLLQTFHTFVPRLMRTHIFRMRS